MDEINYKPGDGIYIGAPVTLPNGTHGTIRDLYIKGEAYLAAVSYKEGQDDMVALGQPVENLRPGWEDDDGYGF